jgi:hypothetical protein
MDILYNRMTLCLSCLDEHYIHSVGLLQDGDTEHHGGAQSINTLVLRVLCGSPYLRVEASISPCYNNHSA